MYYVGLNSWQVWQVWQGGLLNKGVWANLNSVAKVHNLKLKDDTYSRST